MLSCFGWKGTLDLPGLTQVIRAFQDQTHVTTLVRDGDHCVLSLNKNKETVPITTSIYDTNAKNERLITQTR